jgi:hypothetical protein
MHNALQRHYGIVEKEALTASELAALAGVSRSTASGHLGKLADALVAKKFVVLSEEGGALTARGQKFLCHFGADLTAKSGSRRIFCRACLDWSERRRHIAGLAGAAILTRLVALNWLARARGSRALRLTPAGQRGLREVFGIADGRAKIQLT